MCGGRLFKKQRVPSFVLMMTSRGSNTKACILYAFECGEYGHRIELCPKKNQTDVENSPAAKEVLPNPDPQVGSEQRPFRGPWMLPPNRRRKRNQPRGQPKNQGPQDSKYPKGEGRARGQTQKDRMGQGARSEMRAHG